MTARFTRNYEIKFPPSRDLTLNEKINYEYDKKKHSKLPGDFNDSLFFGS